MTSIQLQPVSNEPLLFIKKQQMLVLADVHIGIERELREQGLHIPSKTQQLIDHITNVCQTYHPQKVVICGDIKHTIPHFTYQEERDVQCFFQALLSYAQVHVIPGNHDGNLKSLLPSEIQIHSSKGWVVDEIGFAHGHRWPSEEVMNSSFVVVSHTHPTVMLRDRLGHQSYEPCWLRGFLKKEILQRRYASSKGPEIVVMPAFNPLCGGIAVNTDGLVGPIGKYLDISDVRVFLLDGTFLGRVNDLTDNQRV